MYITENAKIRVLNLIRDTDECIEYPTLNKDGYGDIQTNENGVHIHMLAHRVSYQLATGEDITNEDIICHHCDNPKCINPRHLFKGTHKDNSDDKCRKGRQAKGENNGRYIDGRASNWKIHKSIPKGPLSISKVMEVRILKSQGMKLKEIAAILNIPYQTVKDISCGRTYKDVR
jgi:hypothetical protein